MQVRYGPRSLLRPSRTQTFVRMAKRTVPVAVRSGNFLKRGCKQRLEGLVCAAQEVMAANADFAVRTLAARATTPSDAGLSESALITKCHKPVWALTRILLGHGSEHPPPAGVCLFDFIVVDGT